MIILAGTSDILRITTSAAVALDVTAHFVDHTTTNYTPGRQNTTITTATTTTILSAPAASTQRSLKFVNLNLRGGGQTIIIEYFDGTNAFRIDSITALIGETIEYTDTVGWRVRDANGNLRVSNPLAPGTLLRGPVYITATNAAFAHAPGTRFFVVEGVGGGGGGGGCQNVAGAAGSGGNSGNWGRRTYTSVSGTSNVTIGGAGTTGSGVAGGNGGNSTFLHNGTTLTLPGGIGGTILAGAATNVAGVDNAGNAASTNADIDIVGQLGETCKRTMSNATGASGGDGGSNPLGSGGKGRNFSTGNGGAATGFGAGGGGAATIAATAGTGGAARPGVFIVWDYA